MVRNGLVLEQRKTKNGPFIICTCSNSIDQQNFQDLERRSKLVGENIEQMRSFRVVIFSGIGEIVVIIVPEMTIKENVSIFKQIVLQHL